MTYDTSLADGFLSRLQPPVEWVDDHIEVIDQTLLPDELRVLSLHTVDDVVDVIQRLAVRGAPTIGHCGALGVVLGMTALADTTADECRARLNAVASRIGSARPTAVNLNWAVTRVREAATRGQTAYEIRELALAEARQVIALDRDACTRIGLAGLEELAGRSRLLTHCNTGRLATAGWGTALGVVYAKQAAGEPVEVYASETRPLLQGARLTAWELLDAGIDVTVIPDGASAVIMDGGRVDAVIVGADRIARNGDTANKIGTFTHAVVARRAGVPFYVAAPMSTFDPMMETGAAMVIEERAADELRRWKDRSTAPAEVPVWNPAFDVTPGDLITGIITDRGVLKPPYDLSIPGALGTAPRREHHG
jgi:methylthioribose-1-phosphate isomerase